MILVDICKEALYKIDNTFYLKINSKKNFNQRQHFVKTFKNLWKINKKETKNKKVREVVGKNT